MIRDNLEVLAIMDVLDLINCELDCFVLTGMNDDSDAIITKVRNKLTKIFSNVNVYFWWSASTGDMFLVSECDGDEYAVLLK